MEITADFSHRCDTNTINTNNPQKDNVLLFTNVYFEQNEDGNIKTI